MEVSIANFDPRRIAAALLKRAGGFLVPSTCLTCERHVEPQGGCCAQCWSSLRFIAPPLCPVMGTPFHVDMGEGMLSAEAIANPPPFEQLRAVLLYDETARRLVSLLKYSDRTDLAPWMARWMAVAGKELIAKSDLIVPVPLHRHRLLQRRYNQAAELARHVARAGEVAFVPQAMIRTKKTKQQVGLTQSERERNLSGAFQVPDAFRMDVKSRRILLIDDVYTTGATARAAVRSLKRAGAKEVRVLVFAKVETHLL